MAEHKIANPRYSYVTTTFSEAEIGEINAWIERQDPKPRRSAAIRELALAGLKTMGKTKRSKTEDGRK